MKDIVKYDNKFNLTNLNKLDKVEMDIFMTICSAFSTNKVEEIEYDFSEVKKKANLTAKNYTNDQFKEFMFSTQDKILDTKFTYVDSEGGTMKGTLFTNFYTPENSTRVKVKLNPAFSQYLYDIPEKISFSQFELVNFLVLNSKYSKTLFRHLLQHFKGEWEVQFSELKEILDFPSSYKSTDVIKKLKSMMIDINKTAIINELSFVVHQNEKKRGKPIEKITFYYKINQKPTYQSLEQSYTIEQKVHKETRVVPSDNPLYGDQVKQVQHIERIEHKETCPRCGGQVFTSTVKHGDNKGRKYKVCENSKYHHGNTNTACNYYEWIYDEPPIEQDTANISPSEPATINFNSSGLTNELNVTPITGHENYKPVAAPPEFTAKLQELRGQQKPKSLAETIEEVYESVDAETNNDILTSYVDLSFTIHRKYDNPHEYGEDDYEDGYKLKDIDELDLAFKHKLMHKYGPERGLILFKLFMDKKIGQKFWSGDPNYDF